MGTPELLHSQSPVFGEGKPQTKRAANQTLPQSMFSDGSDLPLFSGTPIPAIEQPFVPQDHSMKQGMLPGMPAIDYDHVLENDKQLRRRHQRQPDLPPSADIFQSVPDEPQQGIPPSVDLTPEPVREPPSKRKVPLPTEKDAQRLRKALAPYVNFHDIREFAARGIEIREALYANGGVVPELQPVLELYKVLFQPGKREQIHTPADVAAMLMVDMGYLDQEELRTVMLDTKNRLQGVVTIYRGSLNTSMVRVGEVYKDALRRNSAAIIVAHNHPSGEPTPSPEDVLVTREIVAAGRLLDVECLDHLVIGQGRWISMRERGLGFGNGS